ncbi:transglycosylase domain-containing protein [Acetonema longum]|uniref:Penicillin-binding protein, 1A family n=1 Tax=Acetonema longum DSM 6540 TaxID=1009370 RepID=F7NG23_9FIRM|nr:PBP1A family penicillin-binding protein [Acetonema longum]EGO64941.1 penicillin-binding protein, 1A family [Acetonema longum DSM 6540]
MTKKYIKPVKERVAGFIAKSKECAAKAAVTLKAAKSKGYAATMRECLVRSKEYAAASAVKFLSLLRQDPRTHIERAKVFLASEEGKKFRHRCKWAGMIAGGTLAVLFIALYIYLKPIIDAAPALTRNIRPAVSSQIISSDGQVIATLHAEENRLPVPLNRIPKHLQQSFIATEDVRFYSHGGIDFRAIFRAMWINLSRGSVLEGGSTITQQLAKNAILTQDRTITRKLQEAFLSWELESQYTKDEILEMYLNQIYFGEGAYGAQTAARVYFGKNVEEITVAEAALLAGIPKRPSDYSPYQDFNAAKGRQIMVLGQMLEAGFITQEEFAAAKQEEIHIGGKKETEREKAAREKEKADREREQLKRATAPYFVDYVLQQMIAKYGANMVYKGGLKIYTTLDMNMQRDAEQTILKNLPKQFVDKKNNDQPQAALVSIDPKTGHIKAMVGGRGTDKFNRAVLAERQPGSSFKSFVYLAAVAEGVSPDTVIEDKEVKFKNYEPKNYDKKWHGMVTLRSALERSLNVIAVRLVDFVGPDKPLDYAEKMGITTLVRKGKENDRTLGLGLGGLIRGVTVLEMTSAYGVLANKGVRAEPVSILKVVDQDGNILETYEKPRLAEVVDPKVTSVLVDMLRGVLLRGTGQVAAIPRPAAGKTGTTNDYRDAWFIGFTPNLVTGVWIGCDNNESLQDVTGGWLPALMWREYMEGEASKLPVEQFPPAAKLAYKTTSIREAFSETPLLKDPKNEVIISPFTPPVQPPKPEEPEADDHDADGDESKDKPKEKPLTKPTQRPTQRPTDRPGR